MGTEPTTAPACPEWNDSPWIADEDKVEVETEERSGEGVVGEVVSREVVEIEDCDGNEDVVGVCEHGEGQGRMRV